jgi:hypothetical protein
MGFGDTWGRDLIGNQDAQEYLKARAPNPDYSLTATAMPAEIAKLADVQVVEPLLQLGLRPLTVVGDEAIDARLQHRDRYGSQFQPHTPRIRLLSRCSSQRLQARLPEYRQPPKVNVYALHMKRASRS